MNEGNYLSKFVMLLYTIPGICIYVSTRTSLLWPSVEMRFQRGGIILVSVLVIQVVEVSLEMDAALL